MEQEILYEAIRTDACWHGGPISVLTVLAYQTLIREIECKFACVCVGTIS